MVDIRDGLIKLTPKPITLVTGGTKGIGLDAVERFASLGHQVITCARTESAWEKIYNSESELRGVKFVKADLSNSDEVQSLFDYVNTEYGVLSNAINNASPKIASDGEFKDVELSKLRSTLNSDLLLHAMCIKFELNLMEQGGSIVNISSVNGLRPTPYAAMYGAAKHGLEGLTKSVAIEAISQGIRINAVAPGITWTPRWEERQKDQANIKAEVSERVPLKRFANPSEIVNAIEWLCSPESSYVVGHTLIVDGGLSLV